MAGPVPGAVGIWGDVIDLGGTLVNEIGGGDFDPETASQNERWFACRDGARPDVAETLVLAARQSSRVRQLVEESVHDIDFGPRPPRDLTEKACYVSKQYTDGDRDATEAVEAARELAASDGLMATGDVTITDREPDATPRDEGSPDDDGGGQSTLDQILAALGDTATRIIDPEGIERRAEGAAAGARTGSTVAGLDTTTVLLVAVVVVGVVAWQSQS